MRKHTINFAAEASVQTEDPFHVMVKRITEANVFHSSGTWDVDAFLGVEYRESSTGTWKPLRDNAGSIVRMDLNTDASVQFSFFAHANYYRLVSLDVEGNAKEQTAASVLEVIFR